MNPGGLCRTVIVIGITLGLSLVTASTTRADVLDPGCVVSVLNRNVVVKLDGSWVLPNIPSNFGPVRVRATCTKDGVTRSGHSELIALSAFEVRDPVAIMFDDPVPVPRSLTVTADTVELSSAGATTQLLVTGTLASGAQTNLTAASTGTSYRVSNPQLARVTPDGLVTALLSGPVIVIATNDGATGLIRVQVVASADSDGDGIPDDVEIANGLNPNDPIDALEDADHDGLTNREEIALGTGLRNPDTDGDGLLDGREPQYGTNPLLFDTDGDGLSDGLEVASGSDPNDASSVNLALALDSIEVQPSELRIIVNALRVLPPVQLTVTGHLRDGRTLDLTPRTRGTTYSTGDPRVANFGGGDGQVFGGETGATTVTVRVPGFATNVPVTVGNFSPTVVASVRLPDGTNPDGLAQSGNFLFIAGRQAGLLVYDVSDRASPILLGSTPMSPAYDVKVRGSLAYVGAQRGLYVFDVSNPAQPVQVSVTPESGPDLAVGRLTLDGDRAILSASGSIRVASLLDPRFPVLLPTGPLPNAASRAATVGNGILLNLGSGLEMGTYSLDGGAARRLGGVTTTGFPEAIAAKGSTAYVGSNEEFAVVDVTNPVGPRKLSTIDKSQSGMLKDVALVQDFALGVGWVSTGTEFTTLSIIDISDPRNARVISRPGPGLLGERIVADESYFFAVGANPVTFEPFLSVGRYLQVEDTRGVAPTAALTAPDPGHPLSAGIVHEFDAVATDDVEVAKVTLLFDGVPVAVSTSRPFFFRIAVPAAAGGLRVEVEAEDFGGNRTRSAPVDYNLAVAAPPTIRFVTPSLGQVVPEGMPLHVEVEASNSLGLDKIEVMADGPFTEPRDAALVFPPAPVQTSSTFSTDLGGIPQNSGWLYVGVAAQVTGYGGGQSIVWLRLPVRTAQGGAPPEIQLLAPADGAVFYEGNPAFIHASATDDGGVQWLRMYVNGALVDETTYAPEVAYSFVAGLDSEVLVRIEASDAAGQVTVVERSIPILPDPGPVIGIDPKGSVVQGVPEVYRASIHDNGTIASVVFRFDGEVVIPTYDGTWYTATHTVLSVASEVLFEVVATDNRGTVSQASQTFPVDQGTGRYTPDEIGFGRVTRPYLPYTIAGYGIPGSISDEQNGIFGLVNTPTAIAIHPLSGDVYFVDSGTTRVRRLFFGSIISVAGSGGVGFSGDGGPATLADFSDIGGIAFNEVGDLYVSDAGNNRIRKVSVDGDVTTVAGTGGIIDTGSRVGRNPLEVSLNHPSAVAVRPDGQGGDIVYIADTLNHQIWELRSGQMSAVAGAGPEASDFSTEAGSPLTAHIGEPVSIAIDGTRLIVSDRLNGVVFELDTATSTLRKVGGTGVPGYAGDNGPATAAQFSEPRDILVLPESAGVIVADYGSARARLVETNGVIVTVAGTGGGAPTLPLTPLGEPLLPSGLGQLIAPGYYGRTGTVVVSEPPLHRIRAFDLNVVMRDLSIGGPPDREIVDVQFSSPVNWISVRGSGNLRDFVVFMYPGLAEEGTIEIPLTVTLTVRDLTGCGGSACPFSTVTETVMLTARIQRPT